MRGSVAKNISQFVPDQLVLAEAKRLGTFVHRLTGQKTKAYTTRGLLSNELKRLRRARKALWNNLNHIERGARGTFARRKAVADANSVAR